MTKDQLKEKYITRRLQHLTMKDVLLLASEQVWHNYKDYNAKQMLALCEVEGYDDIIAMYKKKEKEDKKK